MWVGSIIVCFFEASSGDLLHETVANFPYSNVDTLTISPDGSMVAATFYQDGYHLFLWDLVAKIEHKPLYRLLAERYGDGSGDCDRDLHSRTFGELIVRS